MNWLSFLLVLPLIAKLSLAFTGIVPFQFSSLIYQYGLHPYVNAALVAIAVVALPWQKKREWLSLQNYPPIYRFAIWGTVLILVLQSVLQYFFNEEELSITVQLGTAATTFLMIFTYGVILPQAISLEKIEITLRRWGLGLLILSLTMLFVSSGTSFKGGRFIGVFKHIPHLVTVATLTSFLFLRPLWQSQKMGEFLVSISGWMICMYSIFLSGTRSSLGAAIAGVVIGGFVFSPKARVTSFVKWSLGFILLVFILFFGKATFDWLEGVATGQVTIAGRGAQDGVQTRMEEIERGLVLFEKSPWLGLGLSSKFSQSEGEVDVSSYNSFKDPHNVLISAGVIGGWPFLVWTVALFVLLLGAIVYLLFFKTQSDLNRVWLLYLLCHLPILVIYHWHLSIGGMADRYYWLAFGIVAISFRKNFNPHSFNQ